MNRETFERFAANFGICLDRFQKRPDEYKYQQAADAWRAWQKTFPEPSAGAVVPGEMLFEHTNTGSMLSTFILDGQYVVEDRGYARGWNACRKAMLAGAPEVPGHG